MGCSGSRSSEQRHNDEIERRLNDSKRKEGEKIKLLLLGAGESGKSTLFKQMKLLYTDNKDFSPDERQGFVQVVYNNIATDMKIMIKACRSGTHTPIKSQKANLAADEITKWPKKHQVHLDDVQLLKAVWRDPGMQAAWEERGDIQVQDALEYFMTRIDIVGQEDYLPTNDDILRTRVRTSGVVQENFKVDNAKFEMYDVGGQRNERRKWIHSFEGVTSVIFVAAISEYNQVLYEDSSVNRQDEAVELFRDQLTNQYFVNTPFILFLNKTDLFRSKLPKIPFRVDQGPQRRNVDFVGPHCNANVQYNVDGTDHAFEQCYQAACGYLQQLYESQAPDRRTQDIYTKFTNSTDTNNIRHIMSSCKDIILRGNLMMGGFVV